jgi:hypothetical protein
VRQFANFKPANTMSGTKFEEDLASTTETTLVDNDAVMPRISPDEEALRAYDADLDPQRAEKSEQAKLGTAALSSLTLSPLNLERGQQIRRAFEQGGRDADVAERLLEELTAGEVPVALQLQDIEASLTVMLGRAILEPEAAMQIAKVLRETVALSGAVRTRMQNALGAAANLKAQRTFLAAQRGRLGV